MKTIARLAAVAALAAALVGCRAHNLRRAEAAIARGDYENAELLLQRMLQRSPQDAEAHLLTGKARLLRGRLEGGAEQLEIAAQLDPGLKARIARVYFDAGTRLEGGRMYFQKAIQHDPQIAPQISAWALKAAQSKADAQQWTQALETAQTQYRAGQDQIRAALRKEPFELETMRAVMTKTRAARQNFDQILQGVFAVAASKMSHAGRQALADWPPGRKSASKQ